MTDTALAQRHVERHNQISIRLHFQWDAEWHRVDAQQWSERGFCFFHTHTLPIGTVGFKRSLQAFDGQLVWTRACRDEAQVTEMLLNEAIHRQADRMSSQPQLQLRLMRLMRVQGMVDAKQRVLAALGAEADPSQWQPHIRRRMQEALYQSGVRVQSMVWSSVVANALTLDTVVQDLERWAGPLGKG